MLGRDSGRSGPTSRMGLSVRHTLNGTVLLTGGLGFLGSVCLEQLLSLTEVKVVYLLARSKRGVSAQDRVTKLLSGPLFWELHQQAAAGGENVFAKVRVVEGDVQQPALGMSSADQGLVVSDTDVIIHAAADLKLEAHIQDALRTNYCGTQEVVKLASKMPHLRSLVYISTYFVSNYLPYNTPVPEEVHYPVLQLPGLAKTLTHSELVDQLLKLPPAAAAAEAANFMARLNFVSTYALSKLLSEQLVNDSSTLPGVGKAIVRASLISSMAGAPLPGYISGFAGAPGYCLAYAAGFFPDRQSVAFASDAIPDIIPVDTTAALVVTAAAAAAAHGPTFANNARVYHAASAASYPSGAPEFFERLHAFWSANPPPFRLPGTRYPMLSGRHVPTVRGLRRGLLTTGAKVWTISKLLQLTGKGRQARSLCQGFKAFSVQNSLGYARSIISRVNRARELRDSIVPEERSLWPCVWEEGGGISWERYTATALTGLRCLAFKLPPDQINDVAHGFSSKPGLQDIKTMQQWMAEGCSMDCTASKHTAGNMQGDSPHGPGGDLNLHDGSPTCSSGSSCSSTITNGSCCSSSVDFLSQASTAGSCTGAPPASWLWPSLACCP